MNVITLMGRLTNDPELKTTPNGVSVTSFTIAVDRSYTPKGQEKQTDFITCVAWRNTAEFISKYWHKGQRIAVKGELQTRKYTANDGGQRTAYEVVVDNAFFCESKEQNQQPVTIEQLPQHSAPSAQYQQAVNSQQGFEEIITDEDLPF